MLNENYKPRTITGRLAVRFGVSKRRITSHLFSGAALLCVVLLTYVILARL